MIYNENIAHIPIASWYMSGALWQLTMEKNTHTNTLKFTFMDVNQISVIFFAEAKMHSENFCDFKLLRYMKEEWVNFVGFPFQINVHECSEYELEWLLKWESFFAFILESWSLHKIRSNCHFLFAFPFRPMHLPFIFNFYFFLYTLVHFCNYNSTKCWQLKRENLYETKGKMKLVLSCESRKFW